MQKTIEKDMYEFQSPYYLWKSIDKTTDEFVYSSRYQKEREACLISLFAIGYGLLTRDDRCEVRLVKDKEPTEAELRTSRERLGFQIAMAIKKGRKIKEEYIESPEFIPYRPVKFEEFAERIEDIVTKKMKKYGTGKGVNLLVYCNIAYENLNARTMTNRFSDLAANFDSIWLIMHIFTPAPEGIRTGYAIAKIAPNPSLEFYGFTDDGVETGKPPRRHGVFI